MNTNRLRLFSIILLSFVITPIFCMDFPEEAEETFRFPKFYAMFLTEIKNRKLKQDSYLMPKNVAEDITSSTNGWEKYKTQNATSADQKNAETLLKDTKNTFYQGIQDNKFPDLKGINDLTVIAQQTAHSTGLNPRVAYWYIFEKDYLMGKEDALKTLELKNDQIIKKDIEDAYSNKVKTVNNKATDPLIDTYMNARRTLLALTISSINDAVKQVKTIKTDYAYPEKITDNNFKKELQKLEDIISDKSITKENLSLIAPALDRILYNMLEQINMVTPAEKDIVKPLDIKPSPTGGTTKTGLEGALATLTEKLTALKDALAKK